MSTTTLEAAVEAKVKASPFGYPILDSDQHMSEPVDLWVRRVDKRFRDRAPAPVENYKGQPGVSLVFGEEALKVRGPAGAAPDWMSMPGGYDPGARLKDMAADGVAAAVLFPTFGSLCFGATDAALQEAVFAAYNDWMAEFCAYAPDRLAGMAMISVYEPANAAREIERVRKLGLKGAMIWDAPPEELGPYWSSFFNPVWAAAEAAGIPIVFHKQTGPKARKAFVPTEEKNWAGVYTNMVMGQAAIQWTLANLVYGGVLERFPRLNFVCAEADIAWVPALMARLDKYYDSRVRRNHDFNLSMQPSEQMLRQVWHSFLDDALGVQLYKYAGLADRIMWATDYPHPACYFPNSVEQAQRDFADVPDEDRKKVLHDNCANLFGFKM